MRNKRETDISRYTDNKTVENNNILSSIAPILKDSDKNKVNNFLKTVRVLAENIDEL